MLGKYKSNFSRVVVELDLRFSKFILLNITNDWGDSLQTIRRYHFTLVRMVLMEKSVNNRCWKGCVYSSTVSRNVNW